MTPDDSVRRIEALMSHVWMVRTFLKHSDEAADDDELMEVVRELYDYSLATGAALKSGDAAEYLKQAKKKLAKLRAATDQFTAMQPQISTHTNFQMAVNSLQTAVREIGESLESAG